MKRIIAALCATSAALADAVWSPLEANGIGLRAVVLEFPCFPAQEEGCMS